MKRQTCLLCIKASPKQRRVTVAEGHCSDHRSSVGRQYDAAAVLPAAGWEIAAHLGESRGVCGERRKRKKTFRQDRLGGGGARPQSTRVPASVPLVVTRHMPCTRLSCASSHIVHAAVKCVLHCTVEVLQVQNGLFQQNPHLLLIKQH